MTDEVGGRDDPDQPHQVEEIDATERRRDAIAHLLSLEATVDEWDVMKAEIVTAAATTPVRRRKRSGLMP